MDETLHLICLLNLKSNLKVGNLSELGVLGSIKVLLSSHDSLLEQMFVDGNSVLLGHQHDGAFLFYL